MREMPFRPAPTRMSFTARRPLRVRPVQATYVAPRLSPTGSTGAPGVATPLGPQRRSSVRLRQVPPPPAPRSATPHGRPGLPQVTTTRPSVATCADRRRPWITPTEPKRTVRPHALPARRTRAASRVPARHASTLSPRALMATAAVLPTASSRSGAKRPPARRSATRTNGERSAVQATIASPRALPADQWCTAKSSSDANASKPPSDWPSPVIRRRLLVADRASRATSSALAAPDRWICSVAGWIPRRSVGRCQAPVASRVARPPKTCGASRCAPFQLSSPWPWASKARSCSSATFAESGIGSSRQPAAFAWSAASASVVSASAAAGQRAVSRRVIGAGRICPPATYLFGNDRGPGARAGPSVQQPRESLVATPMGLLTSCRPFRRRRPCRGWTSPCPRSRRRSPRW